jgi:23S rRNA pseudouridine1911/1915/1917 synthase
MKSKTKASENLDHELPEELEEWSLDYSGGDPAEAGAAAGEPQQLIPQESEAGERLDVFLARHLPQLSRSRLQKWVSDGHITVEGGLVKPRQLLREGQKIQITPPAAEPAGDWQAEKMPLDILFEDEQLLVINKPAGLVVHPAVGHASGTLLNGLLAHHPPIAEVARAGIVHRLDRDTTGLMVVAKTSISQLALVRQLQSRSVSRDYLAIAWGEISGKHTIQTWMGRDTRDRQKMAVLPEGKGKLAITHVSALGHGHYRGFPVTLVRCKLETGRTHQIRVHLQHMRHPLVGDQTYQSHAPHVSRLKAESGVSGQTIGRQALHAFQLAFDHPFSGELMRFACPPPQDFVWLAEAADLANRLPEISLGRVAS